MDIPYQELNLKGHNYIVLPMVRPSPIVNYEGSSVWVFSLSAQKKLNVIPCYVLISNIEGLQNVYITKRVWSFCDHYALLQVEFSLLFSPKSHSSLKDW